MTTNLIGRLSRLERAQSGAGPDTSLPRELVEAYLRAVAIALGGYPRAPVNLLDPRDSLGDGVARGLGYRDREDMGARSGANPKGWRTRLAGAEAALCERYGISALPDPIERDHRLLCGALDEWARARADGRLGQEIEDRAGLDRMIGLYGAQAQPTEARA